MKVLIIAWPEQTINFFSAYAPQADRNHSEKDAFWRMLDKEVREVPDEALIILGGDLSGHVGEMATTATAARDMACTQQRRRPPA